MSDQLHSGTGSTPIPDPTLLTTAALTREIASLKELVSTRLDAMDKAQALFEANLNRVPSETDKAIAHLQSLHETRIEAAKQVLETRLDGMDTAIKLIQALSDKLPLRIDEKINSLHGVHDEKFNSIQTQFRERDVRTEQSSKDSKVAVDAALQAAKEAVGEQNKSSALAIAKSEASTTKQIDQLGQLIQSGATAVNDKFTDVKDRVTRLEGSSEGKGASDSHHQAQNNWAIALLVTIILGIFGIAIHFWK
jgi:hypothetical protein